MATIKIEPVVKIRISPAIAYEFQARDVFANFWHSGMHTLTEAEAREMLADAEFNADPWGPDYSAGTKRAYASLAKYLRASVGAA